METCFKTFDKDGSVQHTKNREYVKCKSSQGPLSQYQRVLLAAQEDFHQPAREALHVRPGLAVI